MASARHEDPRPAAPPRPRGAAAPVAEGPWQGGALQRAQAAQVAALETSPAMHAQRQRLDKLTGAPAQRKVMVAKTERPAEETDDPKLKAASADEYLRFYASEQEMRDHLVDEKPVPVGLIKRLALWYRLPDFTNRFFVFGEFHSGVKGSHVQAASHFDKPILDEGLTGWTAGAEPEKSSSSAEDTSTTPKRPVNQGLDENGAKLWRGLQYVTWLAGRRLKALGSSTGGSSSGPTSPMLPSIPTDQTSARIKSDGTYRLVVRGEDDRPRLWTPKEPEPPSTYVIGTEAGDAVSALFPLVFARQIAEGSLDGVQSGLAAAWSNYPTLAGATEKDPLERLIVALGVMETATASWVRRRYEVDDEGSPEANLRPWRWMNRFASKDSETPEADLYRDEYMLLRVHHAAKTDQFAFATMGEAHRRRLESRLNGFGVRTLSAADFYDRCIQNAVDT